MPGQAFLRRLCITGHESGLKVLKPHHHVKITEEHRLDLVVWKKFFTSSDNFCRPFIDCLPLNAEQLDMYSDASGNYKLGFGAYCGPEWTYGLLNIGLIRMNILMLDAM